MIWTTGNKFQCNIWIKYIFFHSRKYVWKCRLVNGNIITLNHPNFVGNILTSRLALRRWGMRKNAYILQAAYGNVYFDKNVLYLDSQSSNFYFCGSSVQELNKGSVHDMATLDKSFYGLMHMTLFIGIINHCIDQTQGIDRFRVSFFIYDRPCLAGFW